MNTFLKRLSITLLIGASFLSAATYDEAMSGATSGVSHATVPATQTETAAAQFTRIASTIDRLAPTNCEFLDKSIAVGGHAINFGGSSFLSPTDRSRDSFKAAIKMVVDSSSDIEFFLTALAGGAGANKLLCDTLGGMNAGTFLNACIAPDSSEPQVEQYNS